MVCNVAVWDRVFRFILSVLILTYAIAGGPFWFYFVGAYLLISAGWGLCIFYTLLRIRTHE